MSASGLVSYSGCSFCMAEIIVSSERPAFCILITSLLLIAVAESGSAKTSRENTNRELKRFMGKVPIDRRQGNKAEDACDRKSFLSRGAKRRNHRKRPRPAQLRA